MMKLRCVGQPAAMMAMMRSVMVRTMIIKMLTESPNQVEIRYLFRLPVSRCVHARFLHSPKGAKKVGVGFLSFHTSPHPSVEDKALFEQRRCECIPFVLPFLPSFSVPPLLSSFLHLSLPPTPILPPPPNCMHSRYQVQDSCAPRRQSLEG